MSGKVSKTEVKKLEQLKNKLDVQQQKFQAEKRKHMKATKELAEQQRQTQKEKKELKNAQKLFEQESRAQQKQKGVQRARGGNSGGNNYKEQYLSMKRKCDGENKKNRELRKRVAQLEAENKVLKTKLSNSTGKRKVSKDPRIGHLTKENKMLKKRLRRLMKELNRKRRWLTRNVNRFKNNEKQWINRQKKAMNDQKFIIKYVFLDDIKKIVQYRKPGKNNYDFQNRIRIKSKGGGETVVKDVQIVIVDGDEVDNHKSNVNKKKKKKKKNKYEREEELDAYMIEMLKEFELDDVADDDNNDDDDDDDMKSEESSVSDSSSDDSKDDDDQLPITDSSALEAQIMYLTQEMDSRAGDLETLKDIMTNTVTHPHPSEDVQQLLKDMDDRQNQMMSNLANVNATKTDAVQQSNDEWNKWIINLASTISDNAQQFAYLMMIADQFLKELQGRMADMNTMNDVFYNENNVGFDELKDMANIRHSEIVNQLQTTEVKLTMDDNDSKQTIDENKEKIKTIYDSLLDSNVLWNGLLTVSNDKFDESVDQRSRLVSALFNKQLLMDHLLKKVNILPTRLLSNSSVNEEHKNATIVEETAEQINENAEDAEDDDDYDDELEEENEVNA